MKQFFHSGALRIACTAAFACLLAPAPAGAQSETQTFGKGRIMTTDGHQIRFHELQLGDSSHRYRPSAGSPYTELAAAKVVRIDKAAGTEAATWALVCGLSGLAGGLLGWMDAENDGYNTSDVNVAPLLIGITAGSALLGGLIGLSQRRYKTVYKNPRYTSGLLSQMQFGVAVARQGIGVSVRVRF